MDIHGRQHPLFFLKILRTHGSNSLFGTLSVELGLGLVLSPFVPSYAKVILITRVALSRDHALFVSLQYVLTT